MMECKKIQCGVECKSRDSLNKILEEKEYKSFKYVQKCICSFYYDINKLRLLEDEIFVIRMIRMLLENYKQSISNSIDETIKTHLCNLLSTIAKDRIQNLSVNEGGYKIYDMDSLKPYRLKLYNSLKGCNKDMNFLIKKSGKNLKILSTKEIWNLKYLNSKT